MNNLKTFNVFIFAMLGFFNFLIRNTLRVKRYLLRKLNFSLLATLDNLSNITVCNCIQFEIKTTRTTNASIILSDDYSLHDLLNSNRCNFSSNTFNEGFYAQNWLESTTISSIGLFDDSINSVISSYVIDDGWISIIYKFNEKDPFYLITSSFNQAKIGIYYPKLNCFVYSKIERSWVDIGLNSLNHFLKINRLDQFDEIINE